MLSLSLTSKRVQRTRPAMQVYRECLNGVRKLRAKLILPKSPYKRPSNASMHRCLRIDELLQLILSFVDDTPTLAGFARVCIALREPAIDALFAHLDHPFAVLMCLPRDLLVVKLIPTYKVAKRMPIYADNVDKPRRWHLSFRRKMRPGDWDLLLARAAKVKSLACAPPLWLYPSLPRVERFCVSNKVAGALLKCPVPHIFPNLQSFQVGDYKTLRNTFTPLLDKLLPPSLRRFECSPDMSLACSWDLSHKIADLCPTLKVLVWRNSFFCPPLPIERWQHLRSLSGPCHANQGLLEKLAVSSTIQQLDIDIAGLKASDLQAPSSSGGRLNYLEMLKLQGRSYEDSAKVMQILFDLTASAPRPKLTELGLDITYARTFSIYDSTERPNIIFDLPPFITFLATHFNTEELKLISITDIISDSWVSSTWLYDVVRPLCTFTLLTHVILDIRPSRYLECTLRGPHILALASHWPLLESIHLGTLSKPLYLQELIKLFKYCPRLVSPWLSVSVRLADISRLGQDIKRLNPRKGVARLLLEYDDAQGTDMDVTVQVLQGIVPNLNEVHTCRSDQFHFWSVVLEKMNATSECALNATRVVDINPGIERSAVVTLSDGADSVLGSVFGD